MDSMVTCCPPVITHKAKGNGGALSRRAMHVYNILCYCQSYWLLPETQLYCWSYHRLMTSNIRHGETELGLNKKLYSYWLGFIVLGRFYYMLSRGKSKHQYHPARNLLAYNNNWSRSSTNVIKKYPTTFCWAIRWNCVWYGAIIWSPHLTFKMRLRTWD